MTLQKNTLNNRYRAEQKDKDGISFAGFGKTPINAISELTQAMKCSHCGQEMVGASAEHYRLHFSKMGKASKSKYPRTSAFYSALGKKGMEKRWGKKEVDNSSEIKTE